MAGNASPVVVMPWLDHGIHSVTLIAATAVTEWMAGSSSGSTRGPAMTTEFVGVASAYAAAPVQPASFLNRATYNIPSRERSSRSRRTVSGSASRRKTSSAIAKERTATAIERAAGSQVKSVTRKMIAAAAIPISEMTNRTV